MSNGFSKNILKFLPKHATSQVKELFASTAIMDFAISMILIFEPIYLYKLTSSVRFVLIYYIFIYFVYFWILPLGAKIAKAKGYEHSIFYSSIFLIAYYLFLFAMEKSLWFAIPAVFCLVWNKALYWSGYHCDFAQYGVKEERGREVGNRVVINYIATILGPLLGGLILKFLGFPALFVAVSVLLLVSNIPILSTKEVFTPTPFSYKEAYKRLVSKNHRKRFWGYLGFGEEFVFMILWPIFIYYYISDYFSIGFLITIAIIISTAASFLIGRMTDKKDKKMILRYGGLFSFFSWLARVSVGGFVGIFFIETWYRIAKNAVVVPISVLTYERAKKKGVMRSIVFFEMVIALSKLFVASVIFIYLLFFPLNWVIIFGIAGIFSIFYAFY